MGLKSVFKKVGTSKEIKASAAYMISSILQRSLSLITMPIFTRILSTSENGVNTVYVSTMAIIIIFVSLQLPYGSFSTAMIKFENDRDGYISSVCGITTFLTIIYFIVYLLFKDFWDTWLNIPSILMILMGIEMLASTSQLLWMGKARFEYKYKPVVILTLFTSITATVCSVAAIFCFTERAVARVIAHSVVISAIGLILYFKQVIKGKKFIDKKYWKYALSFNIPLIPYYLSQVVFNQSDRLMIDRMVGRGEAAIYGVAYSLAFILTFVVNAINNSYVPWMYRKIKSNDTEKIKSVSLAIAIIVAVLIIGVVSLAPEIIMVMGGEKYSSAIWIVPPVSMSLLLLFYAQMFINIEFYYEEKNKLLLPSALSAITNVVLNIIFIKRYGYIAAGYTTLASYILFAFLNYLSMKKICEERKLDFKIYDYKKLWITLFVAMMVAIVCLILYPYRLLRLSVFTVVLLLLAIFRNKIMNMIKRYREEYGI